MRKPRYVLDSYAVLAFFQAEPVGPKVKALLGRARAGNAHVFLSLINLGEILYITGRKLGDGRSKDILNDILDLPIELVEATIDRVVAAAGVKAHYAISYSDAFAVALAQELDAALVTGDPEFKKIESLAEIVWL